MKYGLLFVDKTGVVSPKIAETEFLAVNLLNAAKNIVSMALNYLIKLIKKNFDGNNVT